MYKIKTMNKIAACGLDRIDSTKYTIADDIKDEDGIIVRSAALHEYEMPASLKAIARAGAGVNNIPLDECSKKGIVVFNTPGANANAVKELVMLGLLVSARRVYPAMKWVQEQDTSADIAKLVEKGKSQFTGPELLGKTLGVIGLGAIGIKIANLATSFGMKVYGYDPFLSVDNAWKLDTKVIHANKIEEVYANSDFITIHIPQTNETKGTICTESISKMKDGVRILNFARGGLVVDADIIAAIESGKVSNYVTDFPNEKLLGIDGVIAIPHLGASTPESEDNCAIMAADELVNYLENGNIVNSVNMPNVSMPRSGQGRVGVIHLNTPNMIAQISNVLSKNNLNIENLVNKSRDEFAYTLVDANNSISDTVIEELKNTENVLAVNIY
ncbi:MAG: 3-phosphoglycerate dehydrogenase family protein [Erysipelotrichaceae bacterium]